MTSTTIASLFDRLERDRKISEKFVELTGVHVEAAAVNLSDTNYSILALKPRCAAEALIKVQVAAERAGLEFGEKLDDSEDEDGSREQLFDAVQQLCEKIGIITLKAINA
ncbi:MAG: hypothetical protein WCF85_19010 [Rhodospirillaceae bacterium]